MKKIKVKVTRNDIAAGIENVGVICGCPIWQALNRMLDMRLDIEEGKALCFKGWKEVMVGKAIVFHLPQVAVKWQKDAQALAAYGSGEALFPASAEGAT